MVKVANFFHAIPMQWLKTKVLSPYHLHNLISVQFTRKTSSSSVVTLARPSVPSSLQITNRSFRYASPYLWNQLPLSFHQPHPVHSPPGSPHPSRITSSQSPPSLSPSPTAFRSRLKIHLFHKSFPPVFLVPSGLPSRILDSDQIGVCLISSFIHVFVFGYVC